MSPPIPLPIPKKRMLTSTDGLFTGILRRTLPQENPRFVTCRERISTRPSGCRLRPSRRTVRPPAKDIAGIERAEVRSRGHGAPIFRGFEVQIDELVDGTAVEKPNDLPDRERGGGGADEGRAVSRQPPRSLLRMPPPLAQNTSTTPISEPPATTPDATGKVSSLASFGCRLSSKSAISAPRKNKSP